MALDTLILTLEGLIPAPDFKFFLLGSFFPGTWEWGIVPSQEES